MTGVAEVNLFRVCFLTILIKFLSMAKGRGMAKLRLNVNGVVHALEVASDMPLLWVLRDKLNLTGSKYGCGIGACGACAVLVDGRPVHSCMIPVSELQDKVITTIEGLSKDSAHAVQSAWIELQVPQCGYCQSGQILTAVALLDKTHNPNDADINAAMSPVLCRCGTYQRIRAGIHLAAKLMEGRR